MPAIAPGSAAALAASGASVGISSGGIAVRPSSAVSPGLTVVLSTKPLAALPTSCGVEPCPAVSAPPPPKASWTTWIDAFTVPCAGSFSSITRQITPAANSEIAIGMKTAVLNAVDHRTRSVSTANTSPIAVTSAGTIATHSTLFLIAVSSVSVVNSAS